MKRRICAISISILMCSVVALLESVDAVEVEVRPRLETGLMYYEIEFETDGRSTLSLPGQTNGQNKTADKKTVSDTLQSVGGGATFFIDRMFIDLSGKYACNGKDLYHGSGSHYNEKKNDDNTSVEDYGTYFSSYEWDQNTRFDYLDYAISAGYIVTENLSVFVGYRWAIIDMYTISNGLINTFYTDRSLLGTQRYRIVGDNKFSYKGPFIGALHSWDIEKYFFNGFISAKLGMVYLDSKSTMAKKFVFIDNISNEIILNSDTQVEYTGETWGFTFGLGWRGLTPIDNLSYSLNLGGYRYHFDTNDVNHGSIRESAITFNLGISYVF